MKKWRALLALLIVMCVVFANSSVAQAAEDQMTIESLDKTVRRLSQEEVNALLQGNFGTAGNLPQDSRASYEAYEYSETFGFRLNGELVAEATEVCTVWHYTDGKVHLYSRSITVRRLVTYDASRTYGQIVNTDGSLSFTYGDRVHLYGITNTWDFAIDFRVTPTEAEFDCYEVYE